MLLLLLLLPMPLRLFLLWFLCIQFYVRSLFALFIGYGCEEYKQMFHEHHRFLFSIYRSLSFPNAVFLFPVGFASHRWISGKYFSTNTNLFLITATATATTKTYDINDNCVHRCHPQHDSMNAGKYNKASDGKTRKMEENARPEVSMKWKKYTNDWAKTLTV